VAKDLAAGYWAEFAERSALRTGTKEQRLEYQSRIFPIEDALATRIDDDDPSLPADLIAIAEAAPDEHARGMFGAGILWEYLYNTADANADAIADAAKNHPAFLDALRAAFAGWDGLGPRMRQHIKPLIDE